jgi:hypothetical protein
MGKDLLIIVEESKNNVKVLGAFNSTLLAMISKNVYA